MIRVSPEKGCSLVLRENRDSPRLTLRADILAEGTDTLTKQWASEHPLSVMQSHVGGREASLLGSA